MVGSALLTLTQRINASLRQTSSAGEELAIVCAPVDIDGSCIPSTANHILVFLTNFQQEKLGGRSGSIPAAHHRRTDMAPAAHLNLSVMVAANFGGANYREALKTLSQVIAIFQANPVIDRHSMPGLDPGIERLTVEMQDLDIATVSNLWTMVGAKYVPSVLYKVRMVTIGGDAITGQTSTITQPHVVARP